MTRSLRCSNTTGSSETVGGASCDVVSERDVRSGTGASLPMRTFPSSLLPTFHVKPCFQAEETLSGCEFAVAIDEACLHRLFAFLTPRQARNLPLNAVESGRVATPCPSGSTCLRLHSLSTHRLRFRGRAARKAFGKPIEPTSLPEFAAAGICLPPLSTGRLRQPWHTSLRASPASPASPCLPLNRSTFHVDPLAARSGFRESAGPFDLPPGLCRCRQTPVPPNRHLYHLLLPPVDIPRGPSRGPARVSAIDRAWTLLTYLLGHAAIGRLRSCQIGPLTPLLRGPTFHVEPSGERSERSSLRPLHLLPTLGG